jgi:hypothetical protein
MNDKKGKIQIFLTKAKAVPKMEAAPLPLPKVFVNKKERAAATKSYEDELKRVEQANQKALAEAPMEFGCLVSYTAIDKGGKSNTKFIQLPPAAEDTPMSDLWTAAVAAVKGLIKQ